MKDPKFSKLLKKAAEIYEEHEFEDESLIEVLQEMREIASKENDPLVKKVLRFVYEFIEEEGAFDIVWDEEDQEEVDLDPFQYFLQLLEMSENKMNREELDKIVEYIRSLY